MNGAKGGLTLTGQLGDVMKESARIALTYVRAHSDELDIPDEAFEGREFHVHVPAGAIPKDGPSARGRADRRHPARAQPRRPRRRARGRTRADDLPPGDDGGRGPRHRA